MSKHLSKPISTSHWIIRYHKIIDLYFPRIAEPPLSTKIGVFWILQDYPQMIPVIRHAEIHSRDCDAEGAKLAGMDRVDLPTHPAIVEQ